MGVGQESRLGIMRHTSVSSCTLCVVVGIERFDLISRVASDILVRFAVLSVDELFRRVLELFRKAGIGLVFT